MVLDFFCSLEGKEGWGKIIKGRGGSKYMMMEVDVTLNAEHTM